MIRAFHSTGQLEGDNAIRRGGSPQRGIQNSEHAEQDQGEEKNRKENQLPSRLGHEFEGMFHSVFPCLPAFLFTYLPNALPIHTVILILHAVQVLQVGAHLFGGLRHLSHFNVGKLFKIK